MIRPAEVHRAADRSAGPRSPAGKAALTLAALGWAFAVAARDPMPPSLTTAAPTVPALGLQADPPPVAARFRVSVTVPPDGKGGPATVRRTEWTYLRGADRIALMKGGIDEVWRRDAQGRVSFERVFHAEQRVIDYSTGELATLGVRADWLALSSFVDPAELTPLKLVSRSGRGGDERIRLAGTAGGQSLTVDWLSALHLPARLLRRAADGSVTLIELAQHASTPPAAWTEPLLRSASYLRLDAADFGDMEYEPAVRLSEALDVRDGWRSAHGHD